MLLSLSTYQHVSAQRGLGNSGARPTQPMKQQIGWMHNTQGGQAARHPPKGCSSKMPPNKKNISPMFELPSLSRCLRPVFRASRPPFRLRSVVALGVSLHLMGFATWGHFPPQTSHEHTATFMVFRGHFRTQSSQEEVCLHWM